MATQTLPDVTNARPGDWVSLSWAPRRTVSSIQPSFIVDAHDELPRSLTVSYWSGRAWVPVADQKVMLAGTSNAPSTITFAPVTTTALRLDMTSPAPYDPTTGNLAISQLRVPGVD